MEHTNGTRIISLKDLWDIFIHRLPIMIIAAVLCTGAFFAFNRITFTPQYASTATLYILRQDGEKDTTDADMGFSLALKVINDCTYLLKSHAVVDEVIDSMKLDMTYKELSGKISTSNPENTRILEVVVQADSPKEAKAIVDTLCKIGQNKITEAMGFQQVNFYEHGTLETKPCNTIGLRTYAVIGIIVMLLTYGIYLLLFMLDDSIKTEEDIKEYLELSILGEIPNANDGSRRHYGYYSADQDKKGKKGRKK
ncbi:MAG: Wzz/FepE/Etk N-terminal domain-containing protein [Eubacteriales bacterium]|nr:Wzz/FepE/Etk N-terminal domain-containing protein [Eubacteriales bacterium]